MLAKSGTTPDGGLSASQRQRRHGAHAAAPSPSAFLVWLYSISGGSPDLALPASLYIFFRWCVLASVFRVQNTTAAAAATALSDDCR